eukprot:scaffold244982_cov33-Tisochrysis_lutea.AAC.1
MSAAAPMLALLLLGLFAHLGGVDARKAHRTSRAVQARRRECERSNCKDHDEDERANCILRCQSQACYQKIYGEEELEPGEIDVRRGRLFTACLTAEEREVRRQKLRDRRYGGPLAASVSSVASQAEVQRVPEEATQSDVADIPSDEAEEDASPDDDTDAETGEEEEGESEGNLEDLSQVYKQQHQASEVEQSIEL